MRERKKERGGRSETETERLKSDRMTYRERERKKRESNMIFSGQLAAKFVLARRDIDRH